MLHFRFMGYYNDIRLGEVIKQHCEQNKLHKRRSHVLANQKSLAEDLGMEKKRLSYLMNGRVSPTVTELMLLENALGLDKGTLMEESHCKDCEEVLKMKILDEVREDLLEVLEDMGRWSEVLIASAELQLHYDSLVPVTPRCKRERLTRLEKYYYEVLANLPERQVEAFMYWVYDGLSCNWRSLDQKQAFSGHREQGKYAMKVLQRLMDNGLIQWWQEDEKISFVFIEEEFARLAKKDLETVKVFMFKGKKK